LERVSSLATSRFTENEARRTLVKRILASQTFARSPKLSSFLSYVCERSMEGHADEITEQQIGVHVFHRPGNYHPNDDSIVRSHARLLRQKLEKYFQEEGRDEELLLVVPKGGYVPLFEARARTKPLTLSLPAGGRILWLAVVLTILAIGTVATFRAASHGQAEASTTRSLWKGIFQDERKTIIVPADSALVLVQDITKQPVHLAAYASRDYKSHLPESLSSLASRQYTSIADLTLATRLVRLPEAVSRRVEIRYARDLRLVDLKESNAVLVGGRRANPWTELFEDKMNFLFDYNPETTENKVINKAPKPGESPVYLEDNGAEHRRAYGLVAYLPGVTAVGNVLLIEGTTMAGTECATDFLFDTRTFQNFFDQIGKGSGKLPYFEVLLETGTLAGNAQQLKVLAYRVR